MSFTLPSRVACALLALLPLLGSCDRSTAAKDDPATFRFINRGDVITLDLNQMAYFQDFRVTYAIREGLYSYGPDGFSAEPALAQEAKVSDDKLTWTFTLREAKWSNGDPIVANDFVFSIKTMLDTPGDCTYMLYCIRNAREYESGSAKLEDVGVRAIDDKTLQLTLENPTPYLPQLLAFPPFYPRHEKSMAKFAEKDAKGRNYYRAEYTRPENVVTNGPFVLKDWKPGEKLRFERNENYWDRDNVKCPAAEMIVNNEPQSTFLQYERGNVDFIVAVPPETAVSLRSSGRADLHATPAFATTYLSLNCAAKVPGELGETPNPLADVRVRRALAMTVNKTQLVKTLTRLDEPVANSFVPQRFFKDFKTQTAPDYDVEAAKKLLADAGFPGGANFPTLTIAFNGTNNTRKAMAEMFAYDWKQNLGISVELRAADDKSFDAAVTQKQYTIATSAWMGDYVDPSTFLDRFTSASLGNNSNWSNADYDALMAKARSEPDIAKRQALLEAASSILNTELPLIPLYHYNNICLFRDSVHGITPNAKNTFLMKRIWVER